MAGAFLRFLRLTFTRHPIIRKVIVAGFQTQKGVQVMLHSTTTAAPVTTPNVVNHDAQCREPVHPIWVPEYAVIARIRRRLRKQGRTLRTVTAGKDYAVEGPNPIESIGLLELGRQVEALSPHELVDPVHERGWLHYIARDREVIVDGVKCRYHDRLTKDYTTVQAARKAGARIEDRENLLLCSYDANR